MTKSFAILTTGFAMAVLSATAVKADEFYRESLRDLPGVYVVVEPSRAAQEAGIDSTLIKTRVELFLRHHGIPLLSRQALIESKSAPMLHVKVDAGSGAIVIWVANVLFYQNVLTIPAPQEPVLAATWFGVGGFGVARRDRVVAEAWEAVGEQLEEFANDWLSANASR